jgi:hypothetical protein
MDNRDIIRAHFDKLIHVLDELITTKGKCLILKKQQHFWVQCPSLTRNLYWPNQVEWVLFIRH